MARKWLKSAGNGKTFTEKMLDMAGIPEEERDIFLKGNLSHIERGTEMIDADKAIKILKEAIAKKEKIIVYTDGNDSDGAAGGAIAVMMLREFGADVDFYSNNRFSQGYGMCVSGVEEILETHPDAKVILTVDNGVSAVEAVAFAKEKGLTVVVTDHHDVPETLPDADAIVNPKRKDCPSTFKQICGATVVWKVLRELYQDITEANKYLDIVAIGTVGDVMPLVNENRIMVKEGLRLLNNESRFSLKLLKEMTETAKVDATNTLGFLYVPIVNAVGRVGGNINPVIEMYMSDDEVFLRAKIEEFIELNTQRKGITEIQTEQIDATIDPENIPHFILAYSPDLHEGIVGLIAGRLKEKYNRPTIVLTKAENGDLKGSARSIEGFDMKENLDLCKDLLGGYGGHPMAAGLSLKEENLDALRDRLIQLAKDTLTEDDLAKKYYYLDSYKESDITVDLVEEIGMLEPYGPGFPKPLLRLTDFQVNRVFQMGANKDHLKLVGNNISVIGWRQAKNYSERKNPLKVQALGNPSINVYQNTVNVQFIIEGDNFY